MKRECTCLGTCKGADGLGEGWVCSLQIGSAPDSSTAERTAEWARAQRHDQTNNTALSPDPGAVELLERIDQVEALNRSDAVLKVPRDLWLILAAEARGAAQGKEQDQDHGAELAAVVNDTGSSPTETASDGPFWRTYTALNTGLMAVPVCPQCGEKLNEPPDDERVAIEWCSSCGERCIVTRSLATVYTTETE